MTGSNFAALIREYTRTNSTTLTDATIVLLANTVKDDFAKEIIKVNEDYFGYQATRDLVASSSSDITKREYNIPDETLQLKSVEAALDGTNWVRLLEFDTNKFKRPSRESVILENFSNEQDHAFYDIFRRSLWIYSGTISVGTGTLILRGFMYPADITDSTLADTTNDLSKDPTTTSVALPRQFQELWARKVSMLWKQSREKPIPLNEREQKFDYDFGLTISSITNINLDRNSIASLPNDTRYQE